MRAYRLEVQTDGGREVRWAGSQAEVSQLKAGLVEAHGVKRSAISAAEIEVPTDKQGILKFLNTHALK